MFIEDFNEKKYKETFNSVYAFLKMKEEPSIEANIKYLENYLEDMYTLEGQDWLGRSEGQAITISASIAACQVVLDELKMENDISA
jgi:hypothetical protein